ncbi:MAG: hypothetical protein ACOCY7_05095 [Halodesulfurarchaeum sp.]
MSEEHPTKPGPDAHASVDDNRQAEPVETEAESGGRFAGFGDNVQRYLLWGAFVLSLVFVAMAAFNLYFQVGHVINTWIDRAYRPMFQAAFNLVVLLIAAYIAAIVANRLEVLD